jgi:hypothetical protein
MPYIYFLAGVIVGAILALVCVGIALRDERGMIGRVLP